MPKINTLKPRISAIDTRRGAPVAVERIVGREHGRIRERILWRDRYTCRVCGREWLDITRLVVDHIVPLHLGGHESDENRATLCLACHQAKGEREEKERGGV